MVVGLAWRGWVGWRGLMAGLMAYHEAPMLGIPWGRPVKTPSISPSPPLRHQPHRDALSGGLSGRSVGMLVSDCREVCMRLSGRGHA